MQVTLIEGNLEALIWALGFLWSIRVEYLLSRIHPAASCLVLLLGLPLAAEVLLPHLAWYGLPEHQLGFPDESLRGLAKLAVFVVVIALVALTTAGSVRRRVFCASILPFLSLLALFAYGVAHKLADAMVVADNTLLHGLVMGAIVASALVVPTVLLYRSTAAATAVMALLPAIAKSAWDVVPILDTTPGPSVFVCPFLWTLIIIVPATRFYQRHLQLPLPK